MSLLELLTSRVTPRAPAQSYHSWSTCPVVSLLELYPSQVSPGTLSLSCHYISTRPFMSLLEHLPSRVAPGTHGSEFLSSSDIMLSPSRVKPRSPGQSCHSWISRRRIYMSQRRIAFAQSSHSWISYPVMSLLVLSPTNLLVLAAYCCRPVMSLLVL